MEEKESDCQRICAAEIGGCKGEVKAVKVSGNHWPEDTYYYCDYAIERDRKMGFTVESIEPPQS